jgi:hypothetical protein
MNGALEPVSTLFIVYTATLNSKVLSICEIRGIYSGVAKAARLTEYNAVTLNNKP